MARMPRQVKGGRVTVRGMRLLLRFRAPRPKHEGFDEAIAAGKRLQDVLRQSLRCDCPQEVQEAQRRYDEAMGRLLSPDQS